MRLNRYVITSLIIVFQLVTAQKQISNTDIWYSNEFSSNYIYGLKSMNDGVHYTQLERTSEGIVIVKKSYEDASYSSIIYTPKILAGSPYQFEVNDYEFNADESKLLIATEQESIYRHSSQSNYYLFDISKNRVEPLTDFEKGKQRLATFSPDGSKVAFVRDNNIFIRSTYSEIQVTSDGEFNKIINGAVDWVYEEEFGFDAGFYWSPDSKEIAYYQFNEKDVPLYHMDIYGSLYPQAQVWKYPKAGEKNSKVKVFIYGLDYSINTEVYFTSEADYYVPRIFYTPSGHLMVEKLNRHQNHLEIYKTKFEPKAKVSSSLFFEDKNEKYIEITDDFDVLADGSLIFPSEKNKFYHLYQVSADGQKTTDLTPGDYDVISYYGNDGKYIYFAAAKEGATQKQIYRSTIKGSQVSAITTDKGHHDPTFTTGMKYFIDMYSNINEAPEYRLCRPDGSLIRVLVDNKELTEKLNTYTGGQKKEFFEFTTSEGVTLNGWMLKPADFDKKKKYPVLLTIYNGPGRNTVNDAWEGRTHMWHHLLAQRGIIVVSVDARGTMYKGEDFKKSTYMQLGKYEVVDQIETAKYLGGLKYVDASKIAVQGWSYGGYMSSLLMTKGADYFAVGIAVAPVTNWRYYDSVYTERYMRTPQENASGYDDNSPINYAHLLKGKYLLIHGSADDNVHLQNSMDMSKALVDQGKEFDQFIYTNKDHSIYGGKTRMHIFEKMTRFLTENLK